MCFNTKTLTMEDMDIAIQYGSVDVDVESSRSFRCLGDEPILYHRGPSVLSNILVTVVGGVSSGKTTLLELLKTKQQYKDDIVVVNNDMDGIKNTLKEFYNNPRMCYKLRSLMFSIINARFSSAEDWTKSIHVQEHGISSCSLLTDYNYNQGCFLDQTHKVDLLRKLYAEKRRENRKRYKLEVIVYLQTKATICRNRIQLKKGDVLEKDLPIDFFESLNNIYDLIYIKDKTKVEDIKISPGGPNPVIVIDANGPLKNTYQKIEHLFDRLLKLINIPIRPDTKDLLCCRQCESFHYSLVEIIKCISENNLIFAFLNDQTDLDLYRLQDLPTRFFQIYTAVQEQVIRILGVVEDESKNEYDLYFEQLFLWLQRRIYAELFKKHDIKDDLITRLHHRVCYDSNQKINKWMNCLLRECMISVCNSRKHIDAYCNMYCLKSFLSSPNGCQYQNIEINRSLLPTQQLNIFDYISFLITVHKELLLCIEQEKGFEKKFVLNNKILHNTYYWLCQEEEKMGGIKRNVNVNNISMYLQYLNYPLDPKGYESNIDDTSIIIKKSQTTLELLDVYTFTHLIINNEYSRVDRSILTSAIFAHCTTNGNIIEVLTTIQKMLCFICYIFKNRLELNTKLAQLALFYISCGIGCQRDSLDRSYPRADQFREEGAFFIYNTLAVRGKSIRAYAGINKHLCNILRLKGSNKFKEYQNDVINMCKVE